MSGCVFLTGSGTDFKNPGLAQTGIGGRSCLSECESTLGSQPQEAQAIKPTNVTNPAKEPPALAPLSDCSISPCRSVAAVGSAASTTNNQRSRRQQRVRCSWLGSQRLSFKPAAGPLSGAQTSALPPPVASHLKPTPNRQTHRLPDSPTQPPASIQAMSSTGLPGGFPRLPPNMVFFGPNANCTLDLCPVQYSVYGYRPSLAANISFIALNALAAVIHTYLGFRWKQWWFMACMLVGVVNAIIGYVGRVMMYYNPFNFASFMIQISTLLTSPLFCVSKGAHQNVIIQSASPRGQSTTVPPSTSLLLFRKCFPLWMLDYAAGTARLSCGKTNQTQLNVCLTTGSNTSPPNSPASSPNSSTTSSSPATSSRSSSRLPAARSPLLPRARARSASTSPSPA